MSWKEFFLENKKMKLILAVILLIIGSSVFLIVMRPCSEPKGIMCDYSIGFPLPFFVVTDYYTPLWLIMFLVLLLTDLLIWYILSCLIIFIYNKLKKKQND